MVLLGDIDEQRQKASLPPVSGVLRQVFESLDESDILGPHAIAVHDAACIYQGDAATDEGRAQACTDLLVRQLVPEALLAFDGEWLKSDADACRQLKGPQLSEAMQALDGKVRGLAGVTRFLTDLDRGYTNAKA